MSPPVTDGRLTRPRGGSSLSLQAAFSPVGVLWDQSVSGCSYGGSFRHCCDTRLPLPSQPPLGRTRDRRHLAQVAMDKAAQKQVTEPLWSASPVLWLF